MGAPVTPAGPSPTPRPPQCPPGHGKYGMAGTAAFLGGGWPTGGGEPGRSGRVQPRFLSEAPPGPPTYRLPFLEMGAQGLFGVCCSWGCVSHCCPGPQGRGHGVPAQTGTSYREGVQSLQGQVDHSSGWKPWQFSGPAPRPGTPTPSFCLFIVVHRAHYSWAKNIHRLPIANRILTSQTVISCASQSRPTPASQPQLPPLSHTAHHG